MYVAPPLEQTLFTHIQTICAISKNSVERVLEKKILKVCVKCAIFKLSLAIISMIMLVAAVSQNAVQ